MSATPTAIYAEAKGTMLYLYGGWPAGGCDVHRSIVRWPGWKRSRGRFTDPKGNECSRFEARMLASTVAPVLSTRTLEVVWHPSHLERANKLLEATREAKKLLDEPPTQFLFPAVKRKLMPHQIQAAQALSHMGCEAILADDMGLGKTATVLATFAQSCANRALVICPATVKHNWKEEIALTLGDVDEVPVFLIDGTPRKKLKEMEGMREWVKGDDSRRAVAIINYDLLPHLKAAQVAALVEWVEDEFLICDESHYLKSRKAQRTRFVLEQLGGRSYAVLMSGTPVRNTIEDLWSQVEIVRPGTWSSYHDFANRHLVIAPVTMGGKSFRQVRGAKDLPGLNAVMNTLQVRRAKGAVLNLPPKLHSKPKLELDEGSRKMYAAMKDYAVIELSKLGDDMPVFSPQAKSAVEAALRCEQIAQGFVGGLPPEFIETVAPLIGKYCEKVVGRPGELVLSKSTKLRWVCETIDTVLSQGGAPVIFSRFNGPLFWLREQYQDFGVLHGGLSTAQRQDIIEQFRDGKLAGMLCQIKIAEGFNLTRSQDVIFLGRDWSPAINFQAEDRCHRIGTTGTVNIQIPIVLGTIEEMIDGRLLAKAHDADEATKNITVRELIEAL